MTQFSQPSPKLTLPALRCVLSPWPSLYDPLEIHYQVDVRIPLPLISASAPNPDGTLQVLGLCDTVLLPQFARSFLLGCVIFFYSSSFVVLS